MLVVERFDKPLEMNMILRVVVVMIFARCVFVNAVQRYKIIMRRKKEIEIVFFILI